jgi:hypothetical protein
VLPLGAVLTIGCHGEVGSSTGGSSGQGIDTTPLCAASDPTQVVSPQRVALLTSTEFMNMITAVVNADAAKMVQDQALFPVIADLTVRFPPPRAEQYHSIPDADTLSPFNNTAQAVGQYVTDNFATLSGCAAPASDSCAQTYLNKLAAKAYRRALTTDEQTRFSNFYSTLRSQIVQGYQVSLTAEQASGNAVYGLLMTPQLIWRWELGGSATSTSPPGVYLTDAELASQLSFYLTDQPPDDAMLKDVAAGTLRANLGAHVDRILQGQQLSRDWLRHVLEIYFFLNQLPAINIDTGLYPIVGGGAIFADLQASSRAFLDDALWNGKVMDLITSRKAFVNTNLASMVYMVPVPSGATPTSFVPTMLDPKTRSGLLTDAGFITTRARTTYVGIVPRGLGIKATFLCLDTPGPPTDGAAGAAVAAAKLKVATENAQQQVMERANTAPCSGCHPSFDPYGLVLEWYDNVGRYRTLDDLMMPVDGHTTLPPEVGGATVQSAVELADQLSKSDVFTNCMAQTMLKYALLDATVEIPLPYKAQKGCAAAGIAHTLRTSPNQSFSDLTKAVALSPAFSLRQQVQ